MRMRSDSQALRIASFLKARRRRWVNLVTLHQISGSLNVHSRIDELRHCHGMEIQNKTDQASRPKRSFYRYLRTN